jgi:hypothetical protein
MFHAMQYVSWLLIANQHILQRVKWFGTLSTMTAAIFIAVSLNISQQAWPFAIYLIGASVWSYVSLITRDWALLTLNLLFIITDSYAIIIRL